MHRECTHPPAPPPLRASLAIPSFIEERVGRSVVPEEAVGRGVQSFTLPDLCVGLASGSAPSHVAAAVQLQQLHARSQAAVDQALATVSKHQVPACLW